MVPVESLDGSRFDVVIVGGGINGAGLARDLAVRSSLRKRPLRILLLEKQFWGAGTSGRNSHLIHGGLRYLKYFDFSLVREALAERSRLLALSPDTVRPLEFSLWVNSFGERLFYSAGVFLYDLLATGHKVGSSHYFGERASYWDAASDSAALVIDNVRDAARLGVVARPHTKVATLAKDHVVLEGGARVEAGAVVDARGAWTEGKRIRRVRGSHLVYPKLFEGDTAVAHFHKDGRIIFFIPWGDLERVTLVGTTDVDHPGSPDGVHIGDDEESYLQEIAGRLFPHSRQMPILGRFSSLRPLLSAEGKSASATSREHQIGWREDGVLEIVGGKYTTYRSMAEESADRCLERVAPELAQFYPTRTERFGVPTKRPVGVEQRIAWAKEQEGCTTALDFLTCSTNWAWQRQWTADSLRPIAGAFGERPEDVHW